MLIKTYTADNYKNSPLSKNLITHGKIISPRDAFKIGRQMIELARKNNGVGLAANQVEVDSPIIVVDTRIFYRPLLINESKEKSLKVEECLSLPGIRKEIICPIYVKFSAIMNEQGRRLVFEYWYDRARIFMHEFDHLRGVTILDK